MALRRNRIVAFTLLEILIVVIIIVILISILLPSLAAAKRYAQNVATTTQLQGLSTTIDNYYQTFNNNYPGPIPAAALVPGTTSSTTDSNSGKKISGNQNLLLGLTYPVYAMPYYAAASGTTPPPAQASSELYGLKPPTPPTYTADWVTIAGDSSATASPYKGTPGYVNPMDTTGPIDSSTNPMTNIQPFYKPTSKELSGPNSANSSKDWNPGGVVGITNSSPNTFKFPVLIDRYPEAMPILYYRRMTGVDGAATTSATPVTMTQQAGTSAAAAAIARIGAASLSTAPVNIASFYYDENNEYTGASTAPGLASAGGSFYVQGNFKGASGHEGDILASYDVTGGPTLTKNLTASSTVTARGGYILISAGPDHLYGPNPQNGKDDDIVVVGGTR